MSDAVSPIWRPSGALVAAGAACLFWLFYLATAADPLLGQYPVHPAIEVAAVLATVLLFVLGGSILLFAFLPGGLRATALQRTLVYALLAIVAVFVALSYYGWDLRAALTTSAIVTAAIGFAMQPTLSSVISGVVLNIDYRLRIGDGIIHAGEAIEMESLGWRNVVGRKSSGQLVVFPNAKLADAEIEIVPAGRPARGETLLHVPTAMPPDQISALVAMLVGDLAKLDLGRALRSTPSEFDPGATSTQYRIEYWVSDYRDLAPVERLIQERLWYGLQRAGLYVPPQAGESANPNDPLAWSGHVAITELVVACRPGLTMDAARSLAEGCELLLFGRGESIALPTRMKGWLFLLLRGELVEPLDFGGVAMSNWEGRPSVYTLDRASAERYVATALARRIGPYAMYVVWRAAHDAADLEELCLASAAEIPDDTERARFLEEVRPPRPAALKPGLIFKAERDVAGVLVPHRRLQAREGVTSARHSDDPNREPWSILMLAMTAARCRAKHPRIVIPAPATRNAPKL